MSGAGAGARAPGVRRGTFGREPAARRAPRPRQDPSPRAHLEVDGVHAQNVGVKLAQLGQGARDVVDALDRIAQGGHHLGTVHAQVRGARAQVQVREVGLGLGVAGEEPVSGRQPRLVRPVRRSLGAKLTRR